MTTYLDPSSGQFASPMASSSSQSHHCGGWARIGEQLFDPGLSRLDEEAILERFWEACHPLYPVLIADQFWTYYDSLWLSAEIPRHPSALVDVLLALGMQCGAARWPSPESDATPITCDRSTPGQFWNRRGRSLLMEELEEPSMSTFQSYFFSAVWLNNAGSHNMAHSVMATGIRTGIVLGLHLEPIQSLPHTEREFRKRLWWTVYALDMKFAMELGRPLAVHISNVTCTLPAAVDSHIDPASGFTEQYVKLILATRAAYVTFYRKCGEVLGQSKLESLYHDPRALEECANHFDLNVSYMEAWVQKVPATLLCHRAVHSRAFSTENLTLHVERLKMSSTVFQAAALELLFHSFMINLYRPFIFFSSRPQRSVPKTKTHALSCVSHATATTNLIHQLLSAGSLLNDSVESFQWQWTAAISLVGYMIAYPLEPHALLARRTLDTAQMTLALHFDKLLPAAKAGASMKEMIAKADAFIAHTKKSAQCQNMSPRSSRASMSESQLLEIDDCSGKVQPTEYGARAPIDGTRCDGWERALADVQDFALTGNFSSELELETSDIFDFLDLGEFEWTEG